MVPGQHARNRRRPGQAQSRPRARPRRPAPDAAQPRREPHRAGGVHFAAALLLPPDDFDHAVPYDALTLAHARRLKRTFGVSIQAIIRAAHDRGRISRHRYSSLFKQLSARQWRTNEPDPLPLEQPRVWPAVVRVHREEHRFTDNDLAGIALVTTSQLADLFPEQFTARPVLRAVRAAHAPAPADATL